MVQNPPQGTQRVIPYLMYADTAAALEFLTKAFGFEERMRMSAPDGGVVTLAQPSTSLLQAVIWHGASAPWPSHPHGPVPISPQRPTPP